MVLWINIENSCLENISMPAHQYLGVSVSQYINELAHQCVGTLGCWYIGVG